MRNLGLAQENWLIPCRPWLSLWQDVNDYWLLEMDLSKNSIAFCNYCGPLISKVDKTNATMRPWDQTVWQKMQLSLPRTLTLWPSYCHHHTHTHTDTYTQHTTLFLQLVFTTRTDLPDPVTFGYCYDDSSHGGVTWVKTFSVLLHQPSSLITDRALFDTVMHGRW